MNVKDWILIDNSPNAVLAKFFFGKTVKKILYYLHFINKKVLDATWPNNIFFWDVRWGLPFLNNSIDVVYACHFLEHLDSQAGEKFLNGCYRILKKDGIVRITVPNIDKVLSTYEKELKKADKEAATNTFLNLIFENNTHKWMYNYSTLWSLMKKCGFRKVTKRNYGKSLIQDIHGLESGQQYNSLNLCVEAIK